MNINTVFLVGFVTLGMSLLGLAQVPSNPPAWALDLRHQVPVQEGSSNYHRVTNRVQWDARKTALVICDVWDSHHCLNAVRRVGQVAPRIDHLARELRS
ncbi:MAG: hypothetical protein ACKO8U_17155, partial [Pirellula sp.]